VVTKVGQYQLIDALGMKAQSTIYKGIEYIQVSTLPADQREMLQKTINKGLLIKILVDGKLVSNCLQFKDYEAWFEGVYKKPETKPARQPKKEKGDGSAAKIKIFKKR
jgi:hypothetical protein